MNKKIENIQIITIRKSFRSSNNMKKKKKRIQIFKTLPFENHSEVVIIWKKRKKKRIKIFKGKIKIKQLKQLTNELKENV